MRFRLLFIFILSVLSAQSKTTVVYQSDQLIIKKLKRNVYIHISFLKYEGKKIECNGMIVFKGGESIVVDTPVDSTSSKELLAFMKSEWETTPSAVIATHHHVDCLGGLQVFHREGIPSYANMETISIQTFNSETAPQRGFKDELHLSVSNLAVELHFVGEGHTSDNIVVYIPKRKTLFGGCLVKTIGSGEGNVADANRGAWSATIVAIRENFKTKLVVPGHGTTGGNELLKYTEVLFSPYATEASKTP